MILRQNRLTLRCGDASRLQSLAAWVTCLPLIAAAVLFLGLTAAPGAAQEQGLFALSAPEDWTVTAGDEMFEAKYETGSGPVTYGLATLPGSGGSSGLEDLVHRLKGLLEKEHSQVRFSDGPAFEQRAGDVTISGIQFFASYLVNGQPHRQWYAVFPRPDGDLFHVWQYSAPKSVYAEHETTAREALQQLELYVSPQAAAKAGPPQPTGTGAKTTAQAPEPLPSAKSSAAAPVNNCDRLAAEAGDPGAVSPGVSHEELNADAAFEACEHALRSYPDEPRFLTQLARVHLSFQDKRNNPGEAIRLYRQAAELGYAHAMYSLGAMAKDGLLAGEGRHFREEAARWYALAADKGHVAAMVFLAIVLEAGEGMPPEPDRAADYFLKALKKGSDLALEALLKYPESRSADTIKAVQRRLFKEGYYHGATDGKVGPKTRKAIETFAQGGG